MRVVLTGASGQLGAYLIEALREGDHDLLAWSGQVAGRRAGVVVSPVDLTDATAKGSALAAADPEVIVHAAALSRAEDVRRDPGGGEQ